MKYVIDVVELKRLMKISVVVPVYNLEKEISRCVHSILAQAYKNLEIILVNDGSKDASWEIMQQLAYEDERIVLINKENGGVTSARLEGVKVATGEYIGFVDGDDEIETTMYEFLLGNALKYGADISHCGYQMVFEDGRVNYFHNTGCLVEQDRITGLKDLLDGSRVEPGLCNKLFHKTLLHSLFHEGLMPNDIKINEDLLMNYYLFDKSNKSVYEDKCPYHYMVRMSSASRQKMNRNKIFDPIRVKEIILQLADKEMENESKKSYMSTCVNVYNSLVLEEQNEFKVEKQQVRKKILEHKEWNALLGKKQRILFYLICYFPFFYPIIYKVYAKVFMKNQYE